MTDPLPNVKTNTPMDREAVRKKLLAASQRFGPPKNVGFRPTKSQPSFTHNSSERTEHNPPSKNVELNYYSESDEDLVIPRTFRTHSDILLEKAVENARLMANNDLMYAQLSERLELKYPPLKTLRITLAKEFKLTLYELDNQEPHKALAISCDLDLVWIVQTLKLESLDLEAREYALRMLQDWVYATYKRQTKHSIDDYVPDLLGDTVRTDPRDGLKKILLGTKQSVDVSQTNQ